MPASGFRDNIAVSLDELEGVLESLDDDTTPIICGDFNGNIGKAGGPRGYGEATRAGKYVSNFMDRQNLIAVNLMDTATGVVDTFNCHNGKSVIDYIMIPGHMKNKVLSCHTGNYVATNTSGHMPIEVKLDIDILPRIFEVGKK